ncbi:MAG: PRC-barrel domain-containing protein [Ktedonobacteraceae bacterium]|nr:PRC-barrel domain-containing protein [Ktedonobacteraceae bacterium]
MQNPPTIRKWSDIKGLAAVAIDTGMKVGPLDDFYFDPQHNSVYALQIKTGLFGHRALPTSAINAIGADAVTFASEQQLIKENSDDIIAKLPLGSTVLSYRVLSEGGTVIGTIGNIMLDVSTPTVLKVVAFELAAGIRARISGHYPSFEASQVVRYGRDVIVIPDAVATALQ